MKTAFVGHAFATTARTRSAELKRQPDVRKELRAQALLEQVRKLERRLGTAPNLRNAGFVRKNKYLLGQIVGGARLVGTKYPGTRAARDAKKLAAKYAAALK